jgi:hypothetical protein
MDPSPVSPAASPDEQPALELLKQKLADPSLPFVSFLHAFEAHRQAFPQHPEQLAKKIGKSENWGYQAVGFLDLPRDVLEKAEKERAGYRELQALKSAFSSAKSAKSDGQPAKDDYNNAKSMNNLTPPAKDELNSAKWAAKLNPQGLAAKNALNAPDDHPLMKDSINFVAQLFWWIKSIQPDKPIKPGDLAVRLWNSFWSSWRRVLVIGMILVLAGFGGWQTVHYPCLGFLRM